MPPPSLDPAQRKRLLAQMIRVDHAGEFGAQQIYAGQLAVLGDSAVSEDLKHMRAQEVAHLRHFEKLMVDRRVRPTLLYPLWHIAGFALGASTALMGEKAAMACTIAVEEVIDEHYAQQINELRDDPAERELVDSLESFRQEEVDHRDLATSRGGIEAPGYGLLRGIIRKGCKTAIWLSERL